MTDRIYKIVSKQVWVEAESQGVFDGVAIDLTDGFIHFSAPDQVAETAAKYFAGQTDLVLVVVDPEILGDRLKWEASRNDDLFPHLYGQLEMSAVVSVMDLPLDEDGSHKFPSFEA